LWGYFLGDGNLWQEAVVRIALREKFGREPSTFEMMRFAQQLGVDRYSYGRTADDLKDSIDTAFCKEDEVRASRCSSLRT
jgi:hypothetical protein